MTISKRMTAVLQNQVPEAAERYDEFNFFARSASRVLKMRLCSTVAVEQQPVYSDLR